MRNKQIIYQCLLMIFLLFSSSVFAEKFSATGTFYLQYFGGRVDPATVPRVYKVFEAVRNVADKHANRWPELLVIRNLPGHQVLALPDGHIILSASVIKLIYSNVTVQQGDTRLAFMLGHELAHLAEDDFWDIDVAKALVGLAEKHKLTALLGLNKHSHSAVKKETQADDKGLLYAALAGFPVGGLFHEQQGSDFLSNWVEMTGAAVDGSHAPPAVRATLLQRRLKQRLDQVMQFQFAVRLAHFGRCNDALDILERLQTLFPGRALLNNKGYCYLQQALELMPDEQTTLYWLPSVLDPQSRLSGIFPSTGKGLLRGKALHSLTKHYLDKASQTLKSATEADPYYVPARVNLATVLFLRGEVYLARAAIESAFKLNKQDLDIQSLRLLIMYEEGIEFDMSPKVIGLLQDLSARHPEHHMTRFNLARLLSQQGRLAKAKQQWQILADSKKLPPFMSHLVCKLSHTTTSCQTHQEKTDFSWQLPVSIGVDLLVDNQATQTLAKMQKDVFQLSGQSGSQNIIYSNQKFSVLSFDGIVEMLVLKKTDIATEDELLSKAGHLFWVTALANGEIWNYKGWATWIFDGKIKEVWIAMEQ